MLLLAQPAWWVLGHMMELDASWMLVLSQAFHDHWAFGRQIIFTYGPYGFLHSRSPLDATITLPLNTLVWAVTLIAMWRMLIANMGWRATTALMGLFIGCAAMVEMTALCHFAPLVFALYPWMLPDPAACGLAPNAAPENAAPANRSRRTDLIILHAAAIVMGLLCLVKLTFAAVSAAAILSIAWSFLRQRRMPWPMATFLAALAALWLAAGQTIADFPRFVSTSMQIVSGYDAMAVDSHDSSLRVAMLLTAMGLLLIVAAWRFWSRFRWHGLAPTLAFALMLFVAFKASVVRHDEHVLLGPHLVAGLTLLLAGCWGTHAPPRLRLAVCLPAAAALAFALGIEQNFYGSASTSSAARVWDDPLPTFFSPLTSVPRNLRHVLNYPWTGAQRHARWEASLAPVREAYRLPTLTGPIDFYSNDQFALYGSSLTYQPRPVFQSYSAYTSRLLEINRDHLRGSDAPQWILFRPSQLDQRYPSMSDSLSWPELLTRYRPVGGSDNHVLLQRETQPRSFTLTPLATRWARFGERVTLPVPRGHEVLWARIHVRPTIADSIRRIVYKSKPIRLTVYMADQRGFDCRYIPALGEAGFLLSPCVLDAGDYVQLAAGTDGAVWTDRVVRAMELTLPDGGSDRRIYDIELSLLAWTKPLPAINAQ